MKRCCVIGGTGFIGFHVVNALLNQGRMVRVVGRNESPARQLPSSVEYFPGDFGDTRFLEHVLEGVDEIIDLAYATVPKTSFENPVQDILLNLPPYVNLLELASRRGIQKIVVVSSGGVIYGHADYIPIDEKHALNPISPYGITKLAIEKYAFMFQVTHGLPVVCVRPGNAYGELQLPFAGQGFIATAIASILSGRELVLYGQSGTIRDYIHVEDVASGIVAALLHGKSGDVYNVGSGVGRSNRDVLDALLPYAQAENLTINISSQPLRTFDVPVNVLNSLKLQSDTNWLATIPFEEGIKRVWNWFLASGRVVSR
jgi:UDP-glucose 4-epimerase